MIAQVFDRGWPSAGLFVSPAAWLLSTQVNYALPPWTCRTDIPLVLIVGLALAVISAFGTFLSWRAWMALSGPEPFEELQGEPHGFLAVVGMSTGVLFTLVIILHAVANLFLTGCER